MRLAKPWSLLLFAVIVLVPDARGQAFQTVPGYGSGVALYEYFETRDADVLFRLEETGRGYVVDRNGKQRKFQVPVGTDEFIERLCLLEHRGDFLLAYDVTTGEAMFGRMVRLRGNDLSVKWSADTWGLNGGRPLLKSDFIYVPALGIAEKLAAVSGRRIWKHPYPIDGGHVLPQEPEISGDLAIFRVNHQAGEPAKEICLNDKTGQRVACHKKGV